VISGKDMKGLKYILGLLSCDESAAVSTRRFQRRDAQTDQKMAQSSRQASEITLALLTVIR
jgi:hypothetical protein